MRLIFVRHGESAANAAGVFQGWRDVPLNARGERQAAAAARALAARRDIRPVALYASPLQRAWRTGEIVATALGLDPVAHPGLREIDVGAAAGLHRDEVDRRWPDRLARQRALGLDHGWPGGETGRAFHARVTAALDEIVARHAGARADDAVVVATHGGTIRFALAALRGDAPAGWPDGRVDNCSLSEVLLAADGGAHRVMCVNACAHLAGVERKYE
ncbi:MAG TPA: histidine phosphatase family protein [Thermomicrobiales bacterium]|nr:histidine phosphatase family protein [Thermomicrobiales bacterium]